MASHANLRNKQIKMLKERGGMVVESEKRAVLMHTGSCWDGDVKEFKCKWQCSYPWGAGLGDWVVSGRGLR